MNKDSKRSRMDPKQYPAKTINSRKPPGIKPSKKSSAVDLRMADKHISDNEDKKPGTDSEELPIAVPAVEMPRVVYGVPPKMIPRRPPRGSRKPPGPRTAKKD